MLVGRIAEERKDSVLPGRGSMEEGLILVNGNIVMKSDEKCKEASFWLVQSILNKVLYFNGMDRNGIFAHSYK